MPTKATEFTLRQFLIKELEDRKIKVYPKISRQNLDMGRIQVDMLL